MALADNARWVTCISQQSSPRTVCSERSTPWVTRTFSSHTQWEEWLSSYPHQRHPHHLPRMPCPNAPHTRSSYPRPGRTPRISRTGSFSSSPNAVSPTFTHTGIPLLSSGSVFDKSDNLPLYNIFYLCSTQSGILAHIINAITCTSEIPRNFLALECLQC